MTFEQYRIMAMDTLAVDDHPIAISLQGIANREGPSIYLLPKPDGQERHWVEWYRQYGYEPVEATLDDLLHAFAPKIKGYIVFDPDVPDSLNVAMSLAGVMDSVVCAPSSVHRMKALGLACSMDLRGKFTGRVDACRWLVDNYLGDFDLGVMANWNQGDAAHVHADMDFIVAHCGLGMGCSVNAADYPDEAALWDEVQTAAPDGSMMIGWHTPRDSEATHVYFASRRSVRLYCGYAWNSSFHQHIAASEPYAQEHCEGCGQI